MTAEEAISIGQETIFVLMQVGAPVMAVALVVGLAVSLLQALTQMQEMTLSFVPKIVLMFIALALSLPFMLATLIGFTEDLFARIPALA